MDVEFKSCGCNLNWKLLPSTISSPACSQRLLTHSTCTIRCLCPMSSVWSRAAAVEAHVCHRDNICVTACAQGSRASNDRRERHRERPAPYISGALIVWRGWHACPPTSPPGVLCPAPRSGLPAVHELRVWFPPSDRGGRGGCVLDVHRFCDVDARRLLHARHGYTADGFPSVPACAWRGFTCSCRPAR